MESSSVDDDGESASGYNWTSSEPSKCHNAYWVRAENMTNENNQPCGDKCGKWLIFSTVEDLDRKWASIKTATENGQLGPSSKSATMKDNELAGGSKMKVICVYTYDWTDEADVFRVRDVLRSLGHHQRLCYKSDADTYAGVYRQFGHKRIGKYYS